MQHTADTNAHQPQQPIVIEIPVAWGEMDAFGHVNNVAYFRYIESSRVAFCTAVGWMPTGSQGQAGVWPILHSAQIRFRSPVVYPDTLKIIAHPREVLEDRFTLAHDLFSERQGRLVAQGSGIIVSFDFSTHAKAPLPASVRERVLSFDRHVPTNNPHH
ncbi:MAG: acyl-CoA thioesterase [Phycisphaerales bacterium]|nr:acyl-CoA thioesterase [Phycisphaerales bacterium]